MMTLKFSALSDTTAEEKAEANLHVKIGVFLREVQENIDLRKGKQIIIFAVHKICLALTIEYSPLPI